MITFIIPTMGRSTLDRTLQSLINQKDDDWKSIVVFDKVQPNNTIKEYKEKIKNIILQERFGALHPVHNSGGRVRNFGIDATETEWVGFVDDDDTLMDDYVSSLKKEITKNPNLDCVIFKMIYDNGIVLPDFGNFELRQILKGRVGISFCVKKSFLDKCNLRFENGDCEDYDFLKKIEKAGANILFSDFITYKVRF